MASKLRSLSLKLSVSSAGDTKNPSTGGTAAAGLGTCVGLIGFVFKLQRDRIFTCASWSEIAHRTMRAKSPKNNAQAMAHTAKTAQRISRAKGKTKATRSAGTSTVNSKTAASRNLSKGVIRVWWFG